MKIRSALWRYQLGNETWDELEKIRHGGSLRMPTLLPLPDDEGVLVNVTQMISNTWHYRTYAWIDGGARLYVDKGRPYTLLSWLSPTTRNGRYLVTRESNHIELIYSKSGFMIWTIVMMAAVGWKWMVCLIGRQMGSTP